MEAEALARVTDLSSAAAPFEAGVGRVKEAVADAVEDGIATTKQSLKQARQVAEHLVDDAEHYAKRHPLSTAGTALGVGLGLGVVIGGTLLAATVRVNEEKNCTRCLEAGQARYRVHTDLIDMAVCPACAEEARRLGISVEQLRQV